MKDASKLFDQVNEMLPEIMAVSATELAEKDFDVVLNNYIKFNKLWNNFSDLVAEKLQIMGDYIAHTYAEAAAEDGEVDPKIEESTTTKSEEGDGDYVIQITGIRQQLINDGFNPSKILFEKGGATFFVNGIKIVSNPEINYHQDFSYKYLLLKNGGKVRKVLKTSDDVLQYVLLHKSEVKDN